MYGDTATVRAITGLRPNDLSFASDSELSDWLEARLAEVSALMLQDRNCDEAYVTAQGWDVSWNGIANRWAADFMRFVSASRDSAIIKVDDFNVEIPNDSVPGPGVLKALRRYPRRWTRRRVLDTTVIRKAEDDE